MRLVFAALASAAILLAGCTPEEEPETTYDWAVFDAQQDARDATPVAANAGDVGSILNARRAENGLPALNSSSKLAAAARVHAQDMAAKGYFSHVSPGGSKPSDRVRAQGYRYCFIAENIAKGQPTAERVMQSWMDSPGHRQNNLSRKATEYGVAQAGPYWVLVFGQPGCG